MKGSIGDGRRERNGAQAAGRASGIENENGNMIQRKGRGGGKR